MHRSFKVAILACGLVLFAAARAFADDTPAASTAPKPATVRVSDLLSLSVYGADNEKLGKIEDIVVNPAEGKINYAVLSFGGILGIGDKFFAVPWNELRVVGKGATSAGTQKEAYCMLDVSKDALKNAPGFDKNHWPDFADKTFASDMEKFYGANRTAGKSQGTTR